MAMAPQRRAGGASYASRVRTGMSAAPVAAVATASILALQPALAAGMFGGNGYTPPAPICPAFKCSSGEVAVGKTEHQIWSYGCKDAGVNLFSMGNFDPNDPLKGMKGSSGLDKCCVERDICKQTCGKTSKECHDLFQKCTTNKCKGDQNCQLQAMMADIMAEPYDSSDPGNKYDPEESKCKAYNRGQQEACTCVPKSDFESATEEKLKRFYKKFNPDKLDSQGNVKDVEDVWKKWKGKEPDMFMALATKYKASSVEMREKPKPPPYQPPTGGSDDFGGADEAPPRKKTVTPDVEDTAASSGEEEDLETATFEKRRAELQEKKRRALADEDFDLAQEAKDELSELAKAEVERLKGEKAKALDSEDFLQAKKLKARMDRLSEL